MARNANAVDFPLIFQRPKNEQIIGLVEKSHLFLKENLLDAANPIFRFQSSSGEYIRPV